MSIDKIAGLLLIIAVILLIVIEIAMLLETLIGR